MMHADLSLNGYRDPLRQAIMGESHLASQTRPRVISVLASAGLLLVFLLAWFHHELMFYSQFYFQLLISLCT